MGGGGGGGGGVERHFSVQHWAKLKFWPKPKLNNLSEDLLLPALIFSRASNI